MDFLMDSWTFWMSTKESTLGKGLKDAHSTTTQRVNLFLWEITFRNTLGRKHFIATNVNIKQHSPAILRRTKESTLVKNFTDAQYANFPPLDFCSTLISLQNKKSATYQAKILCVFSPVWMREWVFKLSSLLNDLSHCGQLYLTPACSCLWQRRFLVANVFRHTSRDNCFNIFT